MKNNSTQWNTLSIRALGIFNYARRVHALRRGRAKGEWGEDEGKSKTH